MECCFAKPEHHVAACTAFQATNPDLAEKAEALGLDWKALISEYGAKLAALILKVLLAA